MNISLAAANSLSRTLAANHNKHDTLAAHGTAPHQKSDKSWNAPPSFPRHPRLGPGAKSEPKTFQPKLSEADSDFAGLQDSHRRSQRALACSKRYEPGLVLGPGSGQRPPRPCRGAAAGAVKAPGNLGGGGPFWVLGQKRRVGRPCDRRRESAWRPASLKHQTLEDEAQPQAESGRKAVLVRPGTWRRPSP